jgi:hypothetical protein
VPELEMPDLSRIVLFLNIFLHLVQMSQPRSGFASSRTLAVGQNSEPFGNLMAS